MRCLVIDDDPLVCETVIGWLQQIDGVEYCLQANEGLTALNLISTGEFDLIFLDLNIPELDGESLLRAVPRTLPVVIITADPTFGAKSYDYRVMDFLLKPLTFPRFFQAIEKARELGRRNATSTATAAASTTGAEEEKAELNDGFLFVKDGTRIVKVALSQLLCIKAEANYVSFILPDHKVMSLLSMKRLEELLPEPFVRVHRSWIVNVAAIQKIEDGTVILENVKIPIGESYREPLLQKLRIVS